MPWGDPGVTVKRVTLDQTYNVAWTNLVNRLPTKAFSQTGYLRRVIWKLPTTEATLTVTASNPVTVTPAVQHPMYRAFSAIDITAQMIAPQYQLTRGIDVPYLMYVWNGKNRGLDEQRGPLGTLAEVGAGMNPPVYPYGRVASNPAGYFGDVSAQSSGAATAQTVRYGGTVDLPITEWITFPPATGKDAQGKPVYIAAQEVEVGLLTLQNTQQSIRPGVALNPLWQPNATQLGMYEAPFRGATTAPSAGTLNIVADCYTEFYDVPGSAADQPLAVSQAFIISRSSTDDVVAGGAVTHNFQPGGNLLRAIYVFLDTNGGIVDVSQLTVQDPTVSGSGVSLTQPPNAQGLDGQITFLWGTSVLKYDEKFAVNLMRHADIEGDAVPTGCLLHDFFADGTLVDVVNTAQLTSLRTKISGLPGAVTTMHTIEERMIPVKRTA